MFPEKFQFENKKVRTADINPILLKIASINKGLRGNKKRDKSKKIDLSRKVQKFLIKAIENNVNPELINIDKRESINLLNTEINFIPMTLFITNRFSHLEAMDYSTTIIY
jgi:hypothetical protein